MLKRIRLLDFKSFVDEEVELAPLTLLVGANASGKSNFLDALGFLYGLTLDLPIDEVLDGEEAPRRNGEAWPGLRGGSSEASRVGMSEFGIRTLWAGRSNERDIYHGLICRTSPQPDWYENWKRVEVEPELPLPEPSRRRLSFQPDMLQIELYSWLGNLQLVTPRPGRMREYGQLKRSHLGLDGTNLSGALYRLCQDSVERQTLVDWLTELLAPELADIDFVKVEELGDVMAMFVEKDGTRVSARSLSDGTLRFLGLLLTLRQFHRRGRERPHEVFTLLIEDIDSGLHPARVHVLMEYLRQITREHELQIIATTHAPTCLEALDEEDLRRAIVFGRVPEHEGTIMRPLGDLPHFDDVVERQGISELFTTGWLEMAL